jgi:hypothetical protein
VSATSLLRTVVAALDDAGIPHMLVGSFASMSHGAPRATQDIDMVTLDVDLYLATAEDTVLAKLEWAAIGGSDRHVADAATVLAVGAGQLDEQYLDHWATKLGVSDLLARARRS